MVRTLANIRLPGSSSSSSKSLKKGPASSSSKSSGSSERCGKDNLPVNHYCPRETPSWQKQITHFFERSDLISSSNKENIEDQEMNSLSVSDNKNLPTDDSMNVEESGSLKRKIDEVEELKDSTEKESALKKLKKFKRKNPIIDSDDGSEEMEE